jgi:hypothetical protein
VFIFLSRTDVEGGWFLATVPEQGPEGLAILANFAGPEIAGSELNGAKRLDPA